MEQSVYCAENHTAKQTTNQKNRPFDFAQKIIQQNKQQTKRTVPLILCISLPFPLILFYIYKQGKEDGRNGYSHGSNYDDSSNYYDYYETKYQEGYESGYDDGYSEGKSQYEDEDE